MQEDISNLSKRWDLAIKSADQAQLLQASGDDIKSWSMSLDLEKEFRELIELDQDIRIDHAMYFGVFMRDFANRAYWNGDSILSTRLLEESIHQLIGIVVEHPDSKAVLNELAMSYYYYWKHNDETLPDQFATGWLTSAKEALSLQGCSDLDIASRLSVMDEEKDEARTHVSRLIESGYREPEFKRFCLEFGLCTTQGYEMKATTTLLSDKP